MPILNSIAAWIMKKRVHQIELFIKYPHEVQNEWLKKLLQTAETTEWGKRYEFSSIINYQTFSNRVPLQA
ncbi:MAG: GH3 auxin-responsive promoter family protein, partial [Bacteroidia bacterium]|nr:GH3 auxin-responsive promoter family protein [Bacteroidia bacterium]